MTKSTNQINKEAINSDVDSPAVIAYRVGQVESAVKEGFAAHGKKLDALVNNFATKEEVAVIREDVASLKSDRKWLARLVIGAVVFSMLALIGIGLKVHG
jgi:hypothetical protein